MLQLFSVAKYWYCQRFIRCKQGLVVVEEEEVGGSCQDKTLSAKVACFGGNASKFGIESESSPEKKRISCRKAVSNQKKTIDRGPQYRRSSRVGSSSVLFL